MELREEVLRGIREYGMIPPGARVLLALSGGKDSLSLLHILAELRIDLAMELSAAHVQTDAGSTEAAFEGLLTRVCGALDVPLRRLSFAIMEDAGEQLSCHYCAIRRRAALFSLATREGYDTLAFGHHLDDMAETLVMNGLFHGNLSTMTPRVEFFDGALRVIRPLVFTREERLAAYVRALGLSASVCSCPHAKYNVRASIKEWLAGVEQAAPGAPERIYQAMRELGGRS